MCQMEPISELFNSPENSTKLSSRIYYHSQRNIGDPSETQQIPIRDRHVGSKTNMPNRRQTCIIGDLHASSETKMLHRRPIGNRHA